ncbi:hypothetical protein BJ875DRAFT_471901 [Amylocarpus encephaloides]|uniref:U1-type domain-containing protein n=1 Tax=Amylocarpus encephaloides TaxID=45428 RepID=A0A9P8C321_9HELO|nr:hypothetical protein BJ875DRAFT_471901 [Amylocarpus encephaloides]
MSEYWKSTPKYWCKHCKLFVRDTKADRTNHDATPKHQGNLKRFVRDLHRGFEKDEREKERAKNEVARLNGIVTGRGASSSGSGFGRGPTPPVPKPQATAAQRKQQLAQLVEMGIGIPDEFRPDMAMAGEWQVTSERVIEPEGEKDPAAMAMGVKKRPLTEEEEEEKQEFENKKPRFRTHPIEDEADLDALFSQAPVKRDMSKKEEVKPEVKEEPVDGLSNIPDAVSSLDTNLKQENAESGAPGVVFKKRKAKNFRQK